MIVDVKKDELASNPYRNEAEFVIKTKQNQIMF